MIGDQSSIPNSELRVEDLARWARWVQALKDWDEGRQPGQVIADIAQSLAAACMAAADAEQAELGHGGYDAMAKAVVSACEQRDLARTERDAALAQVARIGALISEDGKWLLHRRWDKEIVRVILVDDICAALEYDT